MKRRIIGFPMVGNTGQNWRASFYIVSRFLPSLVSVVSFCFCGNKKGGGAGCEHQKGWTCFALMGSLCGRPVALFCGVNILATNTNTD